MTNNDDRQGEFKGISRSAVIGTALCIVVFYLLFPIVVATGKSFVTGVIINIWYFVVAAIAMLYAYVFIPKEEQSDRRTGGKSK